MTTAGGNGVLILSEIIHIYAADCAGGGYTNAQCVNLDQNVFLNRIVIGNSTLRQSNFGTPNPAYLTANGNIGPTDYLTKSDDVATNFTSISLADGQVAYVVEGYFASPLLSFLGNWDQNGTAGVYSLSVF